MNDLQFSVPVLYFFFFFFVKNNSMPHRSYLELNAALFEDVESLDSNRFVRLTILDLQALESPLHAIKRGKRLREA